MKIKLELIQSNPYRNMDKYPIDRAKVDALKNSIRETEFWDNLLCRKHPEQEGVFQLAYGHHRITAVRELGLSEIDIPVKDLDNATMLRIMANENMDDWQTSPAIINETVSAAKTFIDGELAKYETWEECQEQAAIFSTLIQSMAEEKNDIRHPAKWYFSKIKTEGAGRNIITAFLGNNWKMWRVESALQVIDSDKIDREAVETFDNTKSARFFAHTVNKYNIPKEEQKPLAEKIVREGRDSTREVKKAIQKEIIDKAKQEQPKPSNDEKEMEKLERLIKAAASSVSDTSGSVQWVINEFKAKGINEMSGIEPLNLRNRIVTLVDTLARIAPYMNMEITRRDLDE